MEAAQEEQQRTCHTRQAGLAEETGRKHGAQGDAKGEEDADEQEGLGERAEHRCADRVERVFRRPAGR